MSELQKQFLEEIEQMFWFNLTNSEKNVEFDFGQYKLNRLYKPFINLYSKDFFVSIEKGITNDKEKQKVIDTFIDFFSLYYNNWDFGYFKSKFNNYQYRVNYSWKDTEFFWATKDCYYVKTSDVVNEIELNAINTQTWLDIWEQKEDVKLKFTKKVKSSNERNDKFDFEIEIKDLFIQNEDEDEIKIGYEIIFYNWEESSVNKSTKLKEIKEELKKYKIDYENNVWLQNALDNFLKKWWRDYFIHKRLKEFLSEELEWYFFQVLKDDIQNKVAILEIQNQINTLKERYSEDKDYLDFQIAKLLKESSNEKNLNIYTFSYAWILNFINIISDLEELKKSLWTKKRKVVREDFCITLWKLDEHIKVDRKEIFEEISKNENQILEWKELLSNDLKHLKDINIDWIINDLKFQNFEKTKNIVVDTKHFDRKSEVYKRISWMWKQELFEDNAKLDWILIKSENFQALNTLQDKYAWKIKTTYIDPLYNTWSDWFVYKDWFSHSTWCSMMYDRLVLGKKMLSDDWVLFWSIDDFEVESFKMIWINIFWEKYLDNFIWRKSWEWRDWKMKNTTTFRKDHEYIITLFNWNLSLNKIKELPSFVWKWSNPDNDIKWDWLSWSISRSDEWSNINSEKYYSVISPSWNVITRQFDITKEEFEKFDKEWKIYWGESWNNVPRFKIYINEKREITPYSIFLNKWTTTNGSKRLWDLLWNIDLANEMRPKPPFLIETLVQLWSEKDSIILDFFFWSWTTLEWVIDLNKDDNWNRKILWIEMWNHFESITLKRMKKLFYSFDWKDWKAQDLNWYNWFFKYLYLNQYDDWFSENGYLKNLESNINALESLKIEENKISDLVFRLKDLKEKIYNADESL